MRTLRQRRRQARRRWIRRHSQTHLTIDNRTCIEAGMEVVGLTGEYVRLLSVDRYGMTFGRYQEPGAGEIVDPGAS